MNRWLLRAMLSVVLLCAPWAPARAQQSALEPPPLGRYLRWGPFRVRPGLEIKNLGYDDNIFSSNSNPESDTTATLAPRLDGLVLFGHRGFVTFREQLDFTVYRHNSDQNFTDQRAKARAMLPLRRIGFFVDGLYNRVKERPVDQEDIRADRDEDGFGVGVVLQPRWRTEIEISRSRKHWDYFDSDADPNQIETIGDQLNRTEYRNRLEVRYRLFGRTRVTLAAHLDTIEFDEAVSADRDSTAWGILPGVDFGEGGVISGSLRLGWSEIDADDPTQSDFDDLVGKAELAYRPIPRATLRLTGLREPGFTVSNQGIFYLNTEGRLNAVYYLNHLIGLESGTSRGKVEFPVSGGSLDREDRISSYEGGVRLRIAGNDLGRRVEYSLLLRHSRRDSTDASQDRTRTSFGLNAVVGF